MLRWHWIRVQLNFNSHGENPILRSQADFLPKTGMWKGGHSAGGPGGTEEGGGMMDGGGMDGPVEGGRKKWREGGRKGPGSTEKGTRRRLGVRVMVLDPIDSGAATTVAEL
jgi:hypothetical protein